jgi:hypothetical protein
MRKAIAVFVLSTAALTGFSTTAEAVRRPRPPAVDCTNAAARMSQLQGETRRLEAERARIRAAQAANDTGAGNFSVKDQVLADQLLVQESANQNAMNANSQAKGDLSRACGIAFAL